MELIDRQAFLKNKVWNCGGNPSDPYYNGYSDALDRVQEVLEAAPTVAAVPVVRGEWTVVELNDWGDEVIYECPICKEAFQIIEGTPEENSYNYCPNCGADMRGAEDG